MDAGRRRDALPGWREWLDFAGAGDVAAPVHRRYSLFSLALDQAIAGRGMALTTRTVVADRLASGVLVAPFGDRYAMRSPFDYSLVRPASGSPPPLARRFGDWRRRESRGFRAVGVIARAGVHSALVVAYRRWRRAAAGIS